MSYRGRRVIAALVSCAVIIIALLQSGQVQLPTPPHEPIRSPSTTAPSTMSAAMALENLPVKGRAAKTGYTRTQFGDGWTLLSGCDTRNRILYRDMQGAVVTDDCKVMSGTLNDPYTGKSIQFMRGADTSDDVQIDHVVALSNAWQTGAQQLTPEQRVALANDPLELLAVDGPANQAKGDGDAATWLPPNKAFRC